MFDFSDFRRLSTMVHPLPEGVSAVCILGAPEQPQGPLDDAGLLDAFLWRPYLEEQWGPEGSPELLFVLMNASSADAENNDSTTSKCLRIAQAHDFGGMIVTEVWPLRSTGNEWLLSQPGAEGSEMNYLQLFTSGGIDVNTPYYTNLMTLHKDIEFIGAACADPRVTTVYCGWGSHQQPEMQARIQQVCSAIQASGKPTVCGGENEDGSPRYVLYTPTEEPFTPFQLN